MLYKERLRKCVLQRKIRIGISKNALKGKIKNEVKSNALQDCTEGYVMLDILKDRGFFITSIKPLPDPEEPFEVLCYLEWGGFTIIQQREHLSQSTDFNKNWIEYRNGFGTLHGNFWLGLEKMYKILQNNNTNGFNLHIHFFDTVYSQCTWQVDKFNLEGESSNYTAIFKNAYFLYSDWCDGMFTSLTPDSRPFSTFDHISYPDNFNCTGREESGWWFADDVNCSFSNINSKRIDDDIVIETANGTVRARKVIMQVKRA
ncbi:hypothetical protein LOTGIDRAFT_168263 [Lottia gigantea]|uniref:Fibrinogen C-terminal domain-containing protein n=1 Tax=Lottia gigantea TaxID=225164 RepID=V3ZVP1_LOTGI|nr:hypothetical protein LOTGIDRAFT_168263 [Lottia gigantea]ESO85001.1 hypothetical protein LOTGIDRAFT_168263 [Lottia gigantea]